MSDPDGYWDHVPHHYYRDHDTMSWGVRNNGWPVVTGLDKSIAAAVACLLNGDVELARMFLSGLPDKMP